MDLESTPSQYTYYHKPYKAQPARPAPEIGYNYTHDKNQKVLGEWQAVVAPVVASLQTDLGLTPQPVYLKVMPNKNAFNLTLDHALREELRAQGFTLSSTADNAVILKPEAYLPEDKTMSFQFRPLNGDKDNFKKLLQPEKSKQFKISLVAVKGSRVIGRVENMASPPAYGYVRGEGRQKWYDSHYGIFARQPGGTGIAEPEASAEAPVKEEGENPVSLLPQPVEQEAIGEP